jgi:NAD+-dependent protein deacetylase sirtuin 2
MKFVVYAGVRLIPILLNRKGDDEDDEDDEDSDQDSSSASDKDEAPQDEAPQDEAPDDDPDTNAEEEDTDEESTASSSSSRPRRSTDGDDWWRFLQATARSQGIPMEYILHHMQRQMGGEDDSEDDDEEGDASDYPARPTCLKDVANLIQSDGCRKIVILAGAGMSVVSGIPDFRSADGLYRTINVDVLSGLNEEQREQIRNDPSLALDQHLFLEHPTVCLELQRDFILGVHEQRWKATLAHRFCELLHTKFLQNGPQKNNGGENNNNNNHGGKLARLYTQNIDGLEDQCATLPRDKVIAVHGSMDRAECAHCGAEMEFDTFCQRVRDQIKNIHASDAASQASTPIQCQQCGRPTVKPGIVLFRSSLPHAFFTHVPRDTTNVDLLLIIGTSLRVAPANTIVYRVPKRCVRVLINREAEGMHLGLNFSSSSSSSTRDYFAQGDIDAVILELAGHLGWWDDLAPYLIDDQLPASSAALLRAVLREREEQSEEVDAGRPAPPPPLTAAPSREGGEVGQGEETTTAVDGTE